METDSDIETGAPEDPPCDKHCKATWQVREYDAAKDAGIIHTWARAHGTRFIDALLPPVGVIACRDGEPKAVAWMYLCCGIGVGIIDRIFTAGGLGLGESRRALAHCVESLRAVARAHDTAVLYAYVPPVLAACSASLGFVEGHRDLVQLIIPTA